MTPARLDNCPAPAKLNLFLHVTGRRADGYHLLQSVFQLVDHGDLLHFGRRDDGVIRRLTDVPGVPHDADLIVRAARLLQRARFGGAPGALGVPIPGVPIPGVPIPGVPMPGAPMPGVPVPGVDIAIDKRLPLGGGLGGGSSDAATTLMALNHLWDAGLSTAELMALGQQLGADVPFFLFGENAFAEGVGERLTAVRTPDCWYVVLEPGVAVPTPMIFSSKELTRNTKPVKITDFSDPADFGKNDLQAVAAALFAPVAEAVEWLKSYGNARMTGSGACVFCAVATEQQADAILAAVPQKWKAWKARALAQHPMRAVVKKSFV